VFFRLITLFALSISVANCGTNDAGTAMTHSDVELHETVAGNSQPAASEKSLDAATDRIVLGKCTVQFFPQGGLTINEYVQAKSRLTKTLQLITEFGFEPKQSEIRIGIAPEEYVGVRLGRLYRTWKTEGNLFIAIQATSDEIEGALLDFFSSNSGSNEIKFIAHQGPSLAKFRGTKEKIEDAIKEFRQNNLNLTLPANVQIAISGSEEIDVDRHLLLRTWEADGMLFVAVTATREEIERFLMAFVRE
jgi:hypothetical protein